MPATQLNLFHDPWGTLAYDLLTCQSQSAQTITLICGYSRSCRDFKLWQKKWHRLNYHVLLYDNRGSGASQANQPFDFHQHTRDLKYLWQQLGIKKSHVIAFSMGGVIASLLATKSPELFHSLTLISTAIDTRHFISNILTSKTLWHPVASYVSQDFANKQPSFLTALQKNMDQLTQNPEIRQQLSWQQAAFQRAPFAEINLNHLRAPALVMHGQDD